MSRRVSKLTQGYLCGGFLCTTLLTFAETLLKYMNETLKFVIIFVCQTGNLLSLSRRISSQISLFSSVAQLHCKYWTESRPKRRNRKFFKARQEKHYHYLSNHMCKDWTFEREHPVDVVFPISFHGSGSAAFHTLWNKLTQERPPQGILSEQVWSTNKAASILEAKPRPE